MADQPDGMFQYDGGGGGLLGILGRFVERHGVNGAVLLLLAFLVWSGVQDRRTDFAAIADVREELHDVRSVVEEHRSQGDEIVRILLAQCVNEAADTLARDRCVGRR